MKIKVLGPSIVALVCLACSGGTPQTAPDSNGANNTNNANNVNNTNNAADMSNPISVRIATFNTSLYRDNAGQLASDLESEDDVQARKVAEVIQRLRPDILLLNEFDYQSDGTALQHFQANYLSVSQNGADPIEYASAMAFPSNTGVHSGQDLDNSGSVVSAPGSREYGGDAFGFGTFEGQYGFAVLSKYPLGATRTFQNFLWKDMPDNVLPQDWYDAAERDVFRLSSKNHVDVVATVESTDIHLLLSHPTPPAFDGPEDRNGRRNNDEIRFWLDYVSGADYMTDDAGTSGSLGPDAAFVILGDLNFDSADGDEARDAMLKLLAAERTQDTMPKSEGAVEAAQQQGQANTGQSGDPALDTADFSDGQVGNLRVDYAIPSSNLNVVASGVFWPKQEDALADLATASDHRLVWVEVEVR